eukprot:586610_1
MEVVEVGANLPLGGKPRVPPIIEGDDTPDKLAHSGFTVPELTWGLIGASIGHLLEWFDWSLFALLAVEIGANFFPSDNHVIEVLFTFAVFGCAFLVRAIGGSVLDISDDIQNEIKLIKSNPDTSRDNVFELAKQVYRQQGSPVIIDQDDTLDAIKQNAENYKNVALPVTLGIDKDFDTWNEQQFKKEFSVKFRIPIECIHVISVRAGSIVADLRLETHATGNKLLIPIETLADCIASDQAKKALIEFGIFAMEFAEPVAGFHCLQQRVIMNPRWNREYGQNHTYWDGPLNDGKSRGGEPYYCPSEWKRFAVQFDETAYDFGNVYDHWPIAYHGTKFDFSMMITLSGLKAFPGAHGCAVYLSPSIKYVSHPRYCRPIKLSLGTARQQQWTGDQINEFRKYDGKWIQCAFMCRVKPNAYKKCRETMGLGTGGKFDNIEKNTIEWIVPGHHGEIIGSDKILIYGIMIKVSDVQQTGY